MTETLTEMAPLYGELARRIGIATSNEARRILAGHAVEPLDGRVTTRDDYHGDPADVIDALMDRFTQQRVAQELPACIYSSEESRPASIVQAKQIYFRADPVDGTKNALALFDAYATAGWFEAVRRGANGMLHLGGHISSSTGFVVSWFVGRSGSGSVRIDIPGTFRYAEHPDDIAAFEPVSILLERDEDRGPATGLRVGRIDRVAAVAAPPARRIALNELYEFDRAERSWLYTVAGNPIAAPLLLGDLGGVIEPEPVRLHDALYLVPLRLAGGHVSSLDGQSIDVLEHFAEMGDLERTIGPFVAAGNGAVAREIRRLRRSTIEV